MPVARGTRTRKRGTANWCGARLLGRCGRAGLTSQKNSLQDRDPRAAVQSRLVRRDECSRLHRVSDSLESEFTALSEFSTRLRGEI
jgi:hypothetical protein